MAPIQPPKNRGGRPRKHRTDIDAAAAVRASKLRWYHQSQQPKGPADFIAYEPPHPNLPTDTPPSGLRTSPDIRIPLDDEAEQIDASESPRPIPLPTTTRHPLRDNDKEVAAQIQQIQIEEQADNLESDEYYGAVSQRMSEMDAEAVEILMGLQSASATKGEGRAEGLKTLVSPSRAAPAHLAMDGLDKGERVCDEEPLISCLLTAASIDEAVMTLGNDSTTASTPSNRPASIQRSHESPIPPRTPSQKTPPLQSSKQSTGKQSASRGRRSFPLQNNNLMSWVTSLPERQPTDTTPTTTPPAAPSNAPPSSPCQIEIVAPLSVQPEPCLVPDTVLDTATPPRNPAPPQSPPPRASPDTAPSSGPSTPAERTATTLAKQLRNFQGCTHDQHREANRRHHEHHRRPDVHSQCFSLPQITHTLRGNDRETPLPDVLCCPKLMKPADLDGLDYRAAFEGADAPGPPDGGEMRDEHLPKNLCLSRFHSSSRKNRRAKTTFDIDSTSCFITSLAAARLGIEFLPKNHAILTLDSDVHFGLRAPVYNRRGVLSTVYVPLGKLPNYCMGNVVGMTPLFIYIFFPGLHSESNYEHSNHLSTEDHELLYDGVISPSMNKIIGSSNIMLHYPATARVVNIDATTISRENLARKESAAREQQLRHTIQARYLDQLWNCMLETIDENPAFHRFRGATLFMHAKNTKLAFMDSSLTAAFDSWEAQWSRATDPQFYNKDRTFVDLAKQTTSEDHALPYDNIPDNHEAEVYLWKKCCLDAYAKTRKVVNADSSPAKGSPRETTYTWATMRDAVGKTFFAAPNGKETQDGLIYSQFYELIKTPFDTSKVYVFDNESVENLALDPGYVRSLQQEGAGITFSKRVCEFAYLHSKKRAYANLLDNRWKSYGVREEHRISLSMMEEIYQQWRQWDLYDDESESTPGVLPYYIIPTKELLGFLYAQINKFCFLFEHVLAHTAMNYSLPETMMMVTALRALRFCYGGSLIQRESLLYKDRWEVLRNQRPVIKEGLGMHDTMERCGFGWFLPKFNWATWRLAPPHGENILVGNILMHEEYKRRWRAVKDLRDVYVRFSQAESWYSRYNVHQSVPLIAKWLEYLHVLNLEQFDTDVWKAMLRANKRSSELAPEAIAHNGEMRFCYHGMRRKFSVNGVLTPPHLVTGNKMRFERMGELLDFLFLWDDGEERAGWDHKPYRTILRKSFDLIERRLGSQRASRWLNEFLHLVRLTHWVLPYASNAGLITTSKTSRRQGLQGRMMWFSAVYADPKMAALPSPSQPRTLYDVLRRARRETFGGDGEEQSWSTSQLIKACCAQGLSVAGRGETKDFWVVGKRSVGLKGFEPLWERTLPPKLKMMEQIRGKSLDELEDLMSGFSRDDAGDDDQDDAADVSLNEVGSKVEGSDLDHGLDDPTGTSRRIMAYFARQSRNGGARRSIIIRAGNTAVAGSVSHLSSTGSGIMAHFGRRLQVEGGRGSVSIEPRSTSMAGGSGSE